MSQSETISRVCVALAVGNGELASSIAAAEYPFRPLLKSGRHYTELEMTRVFLRDGFVDRYSGHRLVFPGTLRLLSLH